VTLAAKVDTMGNGDLFEMMTYLLVILISAVVMIWWLKRRGRSKRK
jgi:predicted ABC-type sugar transport system permease subunit